VNWRRRRATTIDAKARALFPERVAFSLGSGGNGRLRAPGGRSGRGLVAAGAYPVENPVKPDNLIATMYRAIGLDPRTEIRDRQDRPFPIAGEPIGELFA